MAEIIAPVRNPSGITLEKQREPNYMMKGKKKRSGGIKDSSIDNLSGYVDENMKRTVDAKGNIRHKENR